MIDIAEIAKTYPEYNGCGLLDFCEVALPVYRLSVRALVHEKQAQPTIHEFLVRAIGLGFDQISSLSGLLGITHAVAKSALTDLIRSQLIWEQEGRLHPPMRGTTIRSCS